MTCTICSVKLPGALCNWEVFHLYVVIRNEEAALWMAGDCGLCDSCLGYVVKCWRRLAWGLEACTDCIGLQRNHEKLQI